MAEIKKFNQEVRKCSYADIAKEGLKNASEIGTPNFSKSTRPPKTAKTARTPKANRAVIFGTSETVIGKPVSPKRMARPNPEKAVWLSGMHRDVTEEELSLYIGQSIGIAPADFDVRKLVKKGCDLSKYSFVSFRIGCTSNNFNTLMNQYDVLAIKQSYS